MAGLNKGIRRVTVPRTYATAAPGLAMIIGLTGGIACGKSSVARILEERGLPVIDADQVARDVVAPGSDGLAAGVDAFGDGVLDAQGGLDRAKLGEIVFADPDARRRLEAITHPRIAAESGRRMQEALAAGAERVFYEAALLVEIGRHKDFGALWVVAAPRESQIERVMARDGLSRADAEARLAAQMPVAEKAAVADVVIDNSGDLAALARAVDDALEASL